MWPKKNGLLLLFSWVLVPVGVHCQDEKPQVVAIARPYNDSVCLRWAPTNFSAWKNGINAGYDILRFTVIQNGEILSNSYAEKLNSKPIKACPLVQWEQAAKNDNYAALAAQAIYGKDFILDAGNSTPSASLVNSLNEQDARLSFNLFAADQSVLVANLSGFWYTDTTARSGDKYLYKIFHSKSLDEDNSDTAMVYTGPGEYVPLPKPAGFTAEGGDKLILLHWNSRLQEQFFTSYWLEKKTNTDVDFTLVNKHPLIRASGSDFPEEADMLYLDSIAENNKPYVYRLRGRSPFGEYGPWSDAISVSGKIEIHTFPVLTDGITEPDGSILLHWELNGNTGEVQSCRVLRSEKEQGPYDTLAGVLPGSTTEFRDQNPAETNYYRVLVMGNGEAGRLSLPKLVQLTDSTPPLTPLLIRGKADTSGHVSLSWAPSTSKDVYGYRVYRANNSSEEPSLCSDFPVQDTTFMDSTGKEYSSNEIWYRIMTIDKRQNHSVLSAPIKVILPDRIPPAFPQLTSATSCPDGIHLRWIPSTSKDISVHSILRKEKDSATTILAQIYNPYNLNCEFLDSTVTGKHEYCYSIRATDSTGYTSDCPVSLCVVAAYLNSGKHLCKWTLKADYEKRIVRINLIPDKKKPVSYIIYKGIEEEKMTIVSKLSQSMLSWDDPLVMPDTKYYYLVKIYFEDGESSYLVPVKSITY